jgi:hypothetical protein
LFWIVVCLWFRKCGFGVVELKHKV